MGYQVGLTGEAQNDLAAAVRFLAEKSPEAAERIGNELLDAALSLTLFPRRGAAVRRRPGMRKLAHSHYLIFYQINDATQTVEIIRIWDGRQNPLSLRFA
jgi:plasmid stabilization system protein ParE